MGRPFEAFNFCQTPELALGGKNKSLNSVVMRKLSKIRVVGERYLPKDAAITVNIA